MKNFLAVCLGLCLSASAICSAEPLFHEGLPALPTPEGSAGTLDQQFPHFSELVKSLSHAVVNISVEADNEEEEGASEQQLPPFLKRDPDRPLLSLGSGFIISTDGYIVTNFHVVDKAKRVVVRMLEDRDDYDARIVGKDPKTDLALLKIDGLKAPLSTVLLGDSDTIEVGEWVIAIGNQFQLGQTVTAGIVSAKSRKVPNRDASPYDSFIQTDASINPGSSGGPLFNTKGQVIGINTAIFSPGRTQGSAGFNIGIGFSIPINLAKSVLLQLKDKGKVTRGMLGVVIQPVDKDIAAALSVPPEGALVADIFPDSPGFKAGLKRMDIITAFDGKTVLDHDDLPLLVANTPLGKKVAIDVLRNGKKMSVSAVIDEMKESAPLQTEVKPKADSLGFIIRGVPADLMKAYSLSTENSGVLVEGVEPNSHASRAGIGKGDVILEVGGKTISGVEGFAAITKELTLTKPVLILVRRKEGTRFLVMKAR